MIPHIVPMVIGKDYRRVPPLSALLSAVFLVAADITARLIIPPRIVRSILTGLIGGVFFVGLTWRNNGKTLCPRTM